MRGVRWCSPCRPWAVSSTCRLVHSTRPDPCRPGRYATRRRLDPRALRTTQSCRGHRRARTLRHCGGWRMVATHRPPAYADPATGQSRGPASTSAGARYTIRRCRGLLVEETPMPKFMDVHHGMHGVTPEALQAAHQADLDIQGEEGVDFQRAWAIPSRAWSGASPRPRTPRPSRRSMSGPGIPRPRSTLSRSRSSLTDVRGPGLGEMPRPPGKTFKERWPRGRGDPLPGVVVLRGRPRRRPRRVHGPRAAVVLARRSR